MTKMTQCHFKILQERSWGKREKNEIGKVIIVVDIV